MPKIHEMFNTKVHEVSLVTKPAIGVSFDVIKSADGNLSTFLQKIVDMSDQDVINLIRRTNETFASSYNPNKGGNNMDQDALKLFEEMSNKVLKSVTDLQSTVADVKKDVDTMKADKDAVNAAENEKKKKAEQEELEKKLKVGEDAKAEVEKLAPILEEIKKGLEGLPALLENVKKLGEDVEVLKGTENPSNALLDDGTPGKESTVKKSADTPSWPSFFGKN